MFIDAFIDEMNQTIQINKKTRTYNATTGTYTNGTTTRVSIIGIFYEGSRAEQFVSEKFKSRVDGIVIIRPNDVSDETLLDSDTITIGSRSFSIVHVDNVALQGEAIVIYVKEDIS